MGLRCRHKGAASKGVLVVLAVSLGCVLLVGVGYLTSGKRSPAKAAMERFRAIAETPLESTRISQSEKDRIKASVERVAAAVKAGELNSERLGTMNQELMTGPYLSLAIVAVAQGQIADLLKADDGRAQDASMVIDHFARGILEGFIPEGRIAPVLNPVSVENERSVRRAKPSLTEVEAENFLEAALKEIERVEIPGEPTKINLADLIEKVVDKALGTASSNPASVAR